MEDVERIWRGFAKDSENKARWDLERIWKGFGKDLDRIWRGSADGSEMICTTFGENQERGLKKIWVRFGIDRQGIR